MVLRISASMSHDVCVTRWFKVLCIYCYIGGIKHRALFALVVALKDHVANWSIWLLIEFLYVFLVILAALTLCCSLIFLVLIRAVFRSLHVSSLGHLGIRRSDHFIYDLRRKIGHPLLNMSTCWSRREQIAFLFGHMNDKSSLYTMSPIAVICGAIRDIDS